jgi:hypothetical protein
VRSASFVLAQTALAAVVVASTAACSPLTGAAGDRPEGYRLVEGRLSLPDEDLLGRQVTGLQIAALHLDADGAIAPFVSDVFDPATSRAEASFVVPVDGGVDSVVVLQVPSSGGRGTGAFLGQLLFDGVTLLPRGDDDVDLGVVTVEAGARAPADTTLSPEAGTSPLSQTDSDDDGVSNALDDDDDDDGTPDASDDDDAGDGIDDALQVLSALPDGDGDGVADVLER